MTQPKPTASPVPAAKGTRDVYPRAMLERRYLTGLWRDTAIRHGFEEIDGPTFEMLELYTRKSGEGIVSELFRFRREGGEDDYALRPEFTPTLARMYAQRAASLPSPTKWFSIGPYFRAEKPQRGRLREFLQWNVDVLGVSKQKTAEDPEADYQIRMAQHNADVVALMVECLSAAGLSSDGCSIKMNDRAEMSHLLISLAPPTDNVESWLESVFRLLDRRPKIPPEDFSASLKELGIAVDDLDLFLYGGSNPGERGWREDLEDAGDGFSLVGETDTSEFEQLKWTSRMLKAHRRCESWIQTDHSIVRGLAYYTGTVFEVIAEGERAIAGGGRYDNLVELMGGPATPAVGFAMGDVVLGLLLEEKGLMPQGKELLEALSRPGASLRPEAFVLAGSEDEDALIEPLLANLRRGIEREGFDGKPWAADRYAVRPMHARRSYKTTRNLKKLLADAERQHARFAVVLHGPDRVQLKDLDRREDIAHQRAGDFSVDPASPAYVGRAIAERAPTG